MNWQPITDNEKAIISHRDIHQYGERMLVAPVDWHGVTIGRWWQSKDGKARNWLDDGGRVIRPTHFMPLPLEPEVEV